MIDDNPLQPTIMWDKPTRILMGQNIAKLIPSILCGKTDQLDKLDLFWQLELNIKERIYTYYENLLFH